ncbi:TetR family transcriptional regulator [Thalassospira lucentensis]|uniref:TetR family transcriptional regulator n=1 Tax=Thalassospira lucentensis TaxID=168935 RepID=UPI003D2F3294
MPAKKDIPNTLITAAMKLAAEKSWHDVTMIDIAQASGLSVADCYDHCKSKADILRQLVKKIDREVLADLETEDFNEPGHDRLIAVMMARFDALADYRPALRSIISNRGDLGPADGARALKTHLGSMRWMLEAAGFHTSGIQGNLRIAGLTAIYARTVRQWLLDDTTDFSTTMAYLDRELSRAASWDGQVEKGLGKANRICGKFSSAYHRFSRKNTATDNATTASGTDSTEGRSASTAD